MLGRAATVAAGVPVAAGSVAGSAGSRGGGVCGRGLVSVISARRGRRVCAGRVANTWLLAPRFGRSDLVRRLVSHRAYRVGSLSSLLIGRIVRDIGGDRLRRRVGGCVLATSPGRKMIHAKSAITSAATGEQMSTSRLRPAPARSRDTRLSPGSSIGTGGISLGLISEYEFIAAAGVGKCALAAAGIGLAKFVDGAKFSTVRAILADAPGEGAPGNGVADAPGDVLARRVKSGGNICNVTLPEFASTPGTRRRLRMGAGAGAGALGRQPIGATTCTML